MAKAMKEISSGAQKWEGEKWFAELSDKRKSMQSVALHDVSWCSYMKRQYIGTVE